MQVSNGFWADQRVAPAMVPLRRLAAVLAGSLLLAGCGATMGDLATSSTSVAGYEAANLFSPTGYSISNNADGSVRVTAAGPPGTPAARLEKIAMARAAEYGDEQHQKTFIASPAETSIKCGKTKTADKGTQVKIKPTDLRIVAIDVSYSPNTTDARARPVRGTADALKAEIAADTVPPDVQAAAAQEVAQQCGR